MRERPCKKLERCRLTKDHHFAKKMSPVFHSDKSFGNSGLFFVPMSGLWARVISSDQNGWDHVSVSLNDEKLDPVKRCPKWEEMCKIKDLFFDEKECCLQYHPAKVDYVNMHPHTLHIWRPHVNDFPTPPKIMV